MDEHGRRGCQSLTTVECAPRASLVNGERTWRLTAAPDFPARRKPCRREIHPFRVRQPYRLQPAGTGQVRLRFKVPESPAFAPAVNVYASVAAPQLVNVMFAVPTGAGVGAGSALKAPPASV